MISQIGEMLKGSGFDSEQRNDSGWQSKEIKTNSNLLGMDQAPEMAPGQFRMILKKHQASSFKRQATSYRSSSSKQQASSPERQASSFKPQASSSIINLPS